MDSRGLVHIYCGDGKGKTTAALGLVLRCSGRGMPVIMVQFLKSQETGELESMKKLEAVHVLRSQEKLPFYHQMSGTQKNRSRRIHDQLLKEGFQKAEQAGAELLVLDEIIGAYNNNLLDRELLFHLLDNRKANLEVVMTGRNPDEALLAKGDYISRIEKVKHPFDAGIPARLGIEK